MYHTENQLYKTFILSYSNLLKVKACINFSLIQAFIQNGNPYHPQGRKTSTKLCMFILIFINTIVDKIFVAAKG